MLLRRIPQNWRWRCLIWHRTSYTIQRGDSRFQAGEETPPPLYSFKDLKYNPDMQLTAKVKLKTTPEQADILKRTMRLANTCCNWLSDIAWDTHKFGQFSLHKVAYRQSRDTFPSLSSQVVVRCEAKVAQAYTLDKRTKRKFKPLGAIEYDARILTWYVDKRDVSIWTVEGRLHLKFYAGQRQIDLLQGKIGQADLVLIGNDFYLFAPCIVEEAEPIDISDVLGVDLGIVNLASDSDGESYSGEAVEENRRKFSHRRRNLQRNGSKSAKRKLKKISGKQAHYQKDVNHVISKRIVMKAQDTSRGIGLEDLTGIRERATTRRRQRARFANWSFVDLRTKIEYKAKRLGVPVIHIDPRYTSQECSSCGRIDKRNRPDQNTFKCVNCGHVANADTNAALNIRARAVVNRPNGLGHAIDRVMPGTSP